MENSSEKIEKIKDLLNEIDMESFNESLIKDNKIIFILNEQVFRCHMPSQKVIALAEDLENRLKIKYLQLEGYVTRKKLKSILKEKQDIDIDDLEKQKEVLQEELKSVYLDLASTQTSEVEQLKELKEKKKKIEEKFTLLIIEITEYLTPCIEEQVRKKYYSFLTCYCTEKAIQNDEWEKVWKNLDDYEGDNSKLAYNATGYLQTLLLNYQD